MFHTGVCKTLAIICVAAGGWVQFPHLPIRKIMNTLDKIKEAIKEFEDLQNKYAKFGAYDTEPDGEFQFILTRTIKNEKCEIPKTPREWQLFTDMPGVDIAANRLTKKVEEITNLIRNTIIGNSRDIVNYLKDYCWRITIYEN